MGLGNSLFWPTAQAFVQELVSEKDYFDANKLLSASYQVGSILGAGFGGLVVHAYSPIVALWINIVTYFVSAIFISLAPFKRKKIETKVAARSAAKRRKEKLNPRREAPRPISRAACVAFFHEILA